jgi:hypothetical protein
MMSADCRAITQVSRKWPPSPAEFRQRGGEVYLPVDSAAADVAEPVAGGLMAATGASKYGGSTGRCSPLRAL